MSDVPEMVERLEAFIGDMDVPPPYWLSGGGTEATYTYCLPCAKAVAKAHPGAEIDGGWSGESDSCVHCEKCGCLLEYTLTDNGAAYEIEHFSSIRFRRPLTRDDAYHIARMLAAAPDDPDAIKIGKRAMRWLPECRANRAGEGEG